MTKPIDALKTIARYIEAKKPKTLAEAEHTLDLISVMADETILDEDAAESSLAKRLISEPFFPSDKLDQLKKKREPNERHKLRMSALYVDITSDGRWSRPAEEISAMRAYVALGGTGRGRSTRQGRLVRGCMANRSNNV
jgi:hypothetical protein